MWDCLRRVVGKSLVFFILIAANFLIGCPGPGNNNGDKDQGGISGKVTLSGVAATGDPITDATITIRDAAGVVTETTTDSYGSYTVDLTGTAPWILRIPKPGTGTTSEYFYSYAGSGGTAITANIHPLTDPIIRTWFKVQGYNVDTVFSDYGSSSAVPTPKDTEIAIIKAVVTEVVKDILAAAGVSADFDPISSTFAANGSGFDMVLKDTTVTTSGSSMNIAVVPGSDLDSAITTSGGNTTVSVDTNIISLAEDITAPAAPTGLSALAVSSSQVLLTWSAPSDTDVLGYKVFQNGTEVATVTSTVYIVPGLTESTSYSFTVKAFDAAKNLSASAATTPASTTTLAAATDITPPADPTGLIATPVSSSQIDLAWNASTTDTAGYIVYRGTAIAKVFTTTGITVNYSDTGLTPGTLYAYTVKAFDGVPNYSGESSSASATTEAASTDTTAPTAPTGLTATVNSTNNTSEIDLSWTASTDSVGVVGYYVYRNGSKVTTVTTTSYSDINLASKTTYSYTVKAFDLAGNVSTASNSASATTSASSDTTAPNPPTGLTATAASTSRIDLSWTASTSTADTVGYYVYRDGSKVATVTSTSYSDTGLASNTTYSYTVKAFDLAGNLSAAASASAKTNQYEDVSSLIAQAKTALENQDVSTAKTTFLQAYAADPTNKDAAFGAAMTEGIMLLEDTDVVNIINQWEFYAPTVKNVVYGILDNSFEVYGGNSPYCGDDPANNGYTKLTTTSTASPYTYSGSYAYYIVYALPFSQVQLDDVTASTGNAGTPGYAYCTSGEMSGYYMGTAGDSQSITLGGKSLEGSSWVIKANASSTSVTVTTVGSATAKKPGLSKPAPGTSPAEGSEVLAQFGNIMNKLPKNKATFFQKVKKSMASSFPSTAPSISEMQSVIDTKILPVVSDMITKIRLVEGSGYTFTVTPAMTGGAETVNTVLDDGEFYAIDAGLSGMNSIFNILTAYNLDVDYNIIEADPLSAINGPTGGLTSSVDYTKFLTLKTTGAAKMTTALSSLKDAADKAELCYTYVFNEWGYNKNTSAGYLYPTIAVEDNGLRWHSDYNAYDPYDPYDFSVEEDTDTRNLLDAVQMALKGQVTVASTISGGIETETMTDGITTITLSSEPTYDTSTKSPLVFNVTKAFTSPLNRTDLWTMGYDLPIDGTLSTQYGEPVNSVVGSRVIYSEVWQKSDLPDKTLNGIFPSGLPDDIDAFIYLDKAVLLDQATWSLEGDQMASDGTSIYLYKQDYMGTAKIWTINPSTGVVSTTVTLSLGYGANKISWINYMTWHNGALWASGYYYDASSNGKYGIFKIDTANSTALNQIPAPANYNVSGIASDGTYLYAGISNWSTSTYGIAKFQTTASSIPTTLLAVLDFTDCQCAISYGGGYLWVGTEGIEKVDPMSGTVVKSYEADCMVGLYLNSRLWLVDDEKLLSLIAP